MAERSRRQRRAEFSRGRVVVGLMLACILAGGVVYGLARLRAAPSGGRVVYATKDAIRERDLGSERDRVVFDLPADTAVAAISPDGEWVGYARGSGEVWLAAVDGATRFQVADRLTTPLGWTPGGRLVAGELLSDGDLVAVSTDGKRDVLMTGGYVRGSIPVWIDEERFAIATKDEEFAIVAGGEVVSRQTGRVLAASPDGSELLTQEGEKVKVGPIDGESSAIFEGTAERAATSPNGHVAVSTKDGIYVFEGGTQSRRVSKERAQWLAWARAGPIIVYANDGDVYALDVREARPKRISRKDVFPVFSFVVAA